MKPYNFVIKRTFIYPVQIEAETRKGAIEIAEKLKISKEKWQDQGTEIGSEKEFRTDRQNRAMYKFFSIYSEILNNKGHTVTSLAEIMERAQYESMITKEVFKEHVWRPIQKALYQTDSTKKLLKSEEIDNVVTVINQIFEEHIEGYVPFPSIDILYYDKIAQQENVQQKK